MTPLSNKDQNEIINHFLKRAEKSLFTAIRCFDDDDFDGAANRAYYSVFQSGSALLLTKNISRHSHKHFRHAISDEFSESGKMPIDINDKILKLQDMRTIGDYSDTESVTKENAEESISEARIFLENAKILIAEFKQEQEKSSEENIDKNVEIKEEQDKKVEKTAFDPQKGQLQIDAVNERNEALADQVIVEKAKIIPRGMDYNLPNADLSGVQENVISSASAAEMGVKNLQNDATSKDSKAVNQDLKIEAITIAKDIMGKDTMVTGTITGHQYSGEIIAITDYFAIQRLTKNQAVLHEIKNISDNANLEIGEKITLKKQDDKIVAITEKGFAEELLNEY